MAKQPVTDLGKALDEAAAGGRAIVRHGRKRLAIVPAEDLDLLEEFEDRVLGELAEAAATEFRESGEAAIPWEEVKRRAGLT